MKRFLTISFILIAQYLLAQSIQGCLTSLPDSVSNIKIAYLKGKGLAVKQEIPVKNGCFNADWEHPERGIFIVYVDGEHTFDMVVSDGILNIQGDYNDLANVKLSGPGISEFDGFKNLLKSKPSDSKTREYLLGIQDEALRDFLLPQIIPMTPDTNVYWLRKHFWDYTDLNSKSTLINPFFEKNRKIYYEQVLGHDPDTAIKHMNRLFNGQMDDQIRKVFVSTATYHYETSNYMGEDKVFVWLAQTFYNSGFADWMDKEDLAKIKEKSDGLSTELIGNPARDFAFDTKDRGRIKLSEVQSPITILYFWDSTCGHCKKETPRLKKFYEEYKDKGVEVVAITLENEFTSWNKYIDQNELTWINGYESNFERPNFLWYYYIPSTPKKLVLDKDKKIIAKNLDVETTLRSFIDDYLAGKVK